MLKDSRRYVAWDKNTQTWWRSKFLNDCFSGLQNISAVLFKSLLSCYVFKNKQMLVSKGLRKQKTYIVLFFGLSFLIFFFFYLFWYVVSKCDTKLEPNDGKWFQWQTNQRGGTLHSVTYGNEGLTCFPSFAYRGITQLYIMLEYTSFGS